MEIIKPPTDNLYKFLALVGIFLFSLMCFSANQRIEFALVETIRLEKESNVQQARMNALFLKIEERMAAKGEQKLTARLAMDVLGEKDFQELDQTLSDFETNKSVSTAIGVLAAPTMLLYAIVGIIGLVLASVGFILWYVRHQVYVDQKLRLDSQRISKGASERLGSEDELCFTSTAEFK